MNRLALLLLSTALAALGSGCNDALTPRSSGSLTNEIQLLQSEGCESTAQALAVVEKFAEKHQVEVSIERIVIETEADVEAHRFLGSPTFRIHGLDVDPAARSLTEYGFS